ncbi:cell division protein FtsL [Kitasatospora sp. DSM 101779]|nr:cell division protein FtsL [Kitasatospora sp. DSM 101779]
MPAGGRGGRTRRSGALPGQTGRGRITARPQTRSVRGRTPFAVLIVVLLSAGLLGLLMLNTALNEGSFELSRLKKQTTDLTDEKQGLQAQIDQNAAPDALARRARELGMVPGGGPAFLQDDGKVLGKPGQAQDSPPVKRPEDASAAPSAPSGDPSAAAGTASRSPGAGDDGVQIAPAPPAAPTSTAPHPGSGR